MTRTSDRTIGETFTLCELVTLLDQYAAAILRHRPTDCDGVAAMTSVDT